MILVKIFTNVNSKFIYFDILYKTEKHRGDGLMDLDYHINYLRGLREDNDLTQDTIAKLLKTSQTMYARYERGANELPIRHLITLCKYYNVSADKVLGLDTEQRK
jgi:DNA-binding XRE family transcriptional regulator